MVDQQYAAESNSVILNILGVLRWATRAPGGGWDVESTFHKGTQYIPYHTDTGKVVWDVKDRGGYPDKKEFFLLEIES